MLFFQSIAKRRIRLKPEAPTVTVAQHQATPLLVAVMVADTVVPVLVADTVVPALDHTALAVLVTSSVSHSVIQAAMVMDTEGTSQSHGGSGTPAASDTTRDSDSV